jgi:putative NADPH-quinone reductase
MMKTLVLLAHPNLSQSLSNQHIVTTLQTQADAITIRDLADLYPQFEIDAAAEQAALLDHDAVIFQYPFYWYGMPALLKHWFDQVFTYQFAYGSEGDKLKDKRFLASFTVGAPEAEYQPLGEHHFYVPEFCRSMEQTAYYAQMKYEQPLYSFGHSLNAGYSAEEVKENAGRHAASLLSLIKCWSAE